MSAGLEEREHFASQLMVWAQVVEYLPLRPLMDLRSSLRLSAPLTEGYPPLLAARVNLLEAVCRRLVMDFGWPRAYLQSVGDLPPSVPDDVSALLGDDWGPDVLS